ncbi:SPOR domain-containing protein [Actinotalea sp. K2]|uniref:SPOR domain-containing protein n=1 Tax=Actinotalea sp. K2 TaxID=2939438 RepID=UPI002016DE71|nr:SPOR domain-containing protein [Actinotalea sp. K2]MCL3860693.1 SPOR domain-containing protein [Actinotalea sp. K2]
MGGSDEQGTTPADGTGHGSGDYYFDPTTGEVTQGKARSWTGRMGPYATREEAQRALEKAADRTDAWDEADRRWREDD